MLVAIILDYLSAEYGLFTITFLPHCFSNSSITSLGKPFGNVGNAF